MLVQKIDKDVDYAFLQQNSARSIITILFDCLLANEMLIFA